jgi:cytochrome b pre-mRNA-processing protein 3
MGLKDLFIAKRPQEAAARRLYESAVGQARQEVFYVSFGVPDSLDGRFEMVSLHVILLLRRIKQEAGEEAKATGQELFDLMFADMDRSLREMGVGDLGVSKRIKAMAQAFYGRLAAYDAALKEEGDQALRQALRRNLLGTLPEVREEGLDALAGYVLAQSEALAGQTREAVLEGALTFAPPPGGE